MKKALPKTERLPPGQRQAGGIFNYGAVSQKTYQTSTNEMGEGFQRVEKFRPPAASLENLLKVFITRGLDAKMAKVCFINV